MYPSNIYELINDTFLCNFYAKRQGNAELVGLEQINQWREKLAHFEYENDIVHTDRQRFYKWSGSFGENKIGNYLKVWFPNLIKLLEIGEGKLSLCGGAIIELITKNSGYYFNDFDLFFHCDSVDEAENILRKCKEYLKDLAYHFERSIGVYTVKIQGYPKIQFIKRVYKSKDQILLGFDLAGSRYGWNPFDGFFTTICGGIAYALGAFPIDLTQRSFSHGYRLFKYQMKFSLLFPGHPDDEENLYTPDGFLDGYHDNPLGKTFMANYKQFESDYSVRPSNNLRSLLNNKFYNFTFFSENYDHIENLTDECIRDSLHESEFLINKDDLTGLHNSKQLKEFLGKFNKEFSLAYYVEEDIELAKKIWNEALEQHVETGRKIAIMLKENPWRYEDPGGQNFGSISGTYSRGSIHNTFGKLNPIIADPREWYGPNYKPVIVGINNERYYILQLCLNRIIEIPSDLINIICYYWFEAEVYDARKRLFSIGRKYQIEEEIEEEIIVNGRRYLLAKEDKFYQKNSNDYW